MQSNNNLYKNLPGNINNRGPNYSNTRLNNEFHSKKGNYNNSNYNNNNINYDQGPFMNNNNNNNNNNFNYNKPSYNVNNNNKQSYAMNNLNNNLNLNVNNNNNNFNNMNNNNKANYADELNQAKESLKLLKLKMNNGGNTGNFGGNINRDNNIIIPNSNKNGQVNGNYRKPFKPNLNGNSNDDYLDEGNYGNNNNNFGVNDNNKAIGNINNNNNRNNIGSRLNNNVNGKNTAINKMGTNIGMNQNKINSNFQDQIPSQRPSTRSKTNSTPLNNNTNNVKGRVATNYTSKINPTSIKGKDTNIINKPNFQVEELEDDRPAFNPKGPKFDPYDDDEIDDGEDDGTRIPCRQCGRKFNPDAIKKHEKVCKKVFCAERKKFDIKKKRILDSEHAMILKRSEHGGKSGNNKQNDKKAKWKKQSEEFRAILRGGKTGPGTSAPSSITDDYVHCNMCNRKYNENAYSKHLPTCERRTKEAQFKKGGLVNTQTNMNMQGANRNINNNNNNYGNQIGGNRMGGNMMNNNTNAKYGRK